MNDDKKTYIIEKAAELFFKHGIKSVTLDEIAGQASISKKTIYNFFRDKEDLVDQLTDKYFVCSKHFQIAQDDDLNAIDQIIKIRSHVVQILGLLQSNIDYDLRRTYPRIAEKLENFKRVTVYNNECLLLEKGKKEGLFRPELDQDFIAKMTVGRSLFILNPDNGLFDEKETMSLELFDKMIDYHLHAICTPKGIEYYKQQLNNVQNEN